MRRLTVLDNTQNQDFSLLQKKQDCENLRKIANKTIGDLQSESGILVFPPKVEDSNDKIKDSVIFSLKEHDEQFSIDTGNIMGFIGRKDTELNILSRFTHRNSDNSISEDSDFFLHYMLEKVCHINLTKLKSTRDKDSIFDLLPFLFPHYLIEALNQGLYKEYQIREYNDSNVRGVIDVNRHIRFNIPANGKIAYRTREYSYDNPITELVRHTIEYMRVSSIFKHALSGNQETKDAVAVICNATPLYNRMERSKILAKTNKPIKSPYFNKYQNLRKICRMILLRERIKYDSTSNKIYGILFDGAWLWEEYLATMLTQKGFVHPQNKIGVGIVHPFIGSPVGKFIPDFYLTKKDYSKHQLADVILDAKYKNFDTANPPAEDLAQIIAYIHVMDARKGYFIYPSKSETETKTEWTLKPFAGTQAKIGKMPFYIPQNESTYADFKGRIKDSESSFIPSKLQY